MDRSEEGPEEKPEMRTIGRSWRWAGLIQITCQMGEKLKRWQKNNFSWSPPSSLSVTVLSWCCLLPITDISPVPSLSSTPLLSPRAVPSSLLVPEPLVR